MQSNGWRCIGKEVKVKYVCEGSGNVVEETWRYTQYTLSYSACGKTDYEVVWWSKTQWWNTDYMPWDIYPSCEGTTLYPVYRYRPTVQYSCTVGSADPSGAWYIASTKTPTSSTSSSDLVWHLAAAWTTSATVNNKPCQYICNTCYMGGEWWRCVGQTFKVTYDCGWGNKVTQDLQYGRIATMTLSSSACSKINYELLWWSKTSWSTSRDYDKWWQYDSCTGTTLYPVYRYRPTCWYAISYDANGWTPTPSSESVVCQSSMTLASAPTKANYTFDGWWTQKIWWVKRWNAWASYTPSGDETLYAHWVYDPCTYTVTYDANGWMFADWTIGTKSVSVSCGGQTKVLSDPTRNGYTFLGWYTKKTNWTKIEWLDYEPNGDITLYAHWEQCVRTITYNANGWTASLSSDSVSCGSSTTLPDATKTDYDFDGWYTSKNWWTKAWDAWVDYTPSGDVTLYAHWTEQSYNITEVWPVANIRNKISSNPLKVQAIINWKTYTADCQIAKWRSDTCTFNGDKLSPGNYWIVIKPISWQPCKLESNGTAWLIDQYWWMWWSVNGQGYYWNCEDEAGVCDYATAGCSGWEYELIQNLSNGKYWRCKWYWNGSTHTCRLTWWCKGSCSYDWTAGCSGNGGNDIYPNNGKGYAGFSEAECKSAGYKIVEWTNCQAIEPCYLSTKLSDPYAGIKSCSGKYGWCAKWTADLTCEQQTDNGTVTTYHGDDANAKCNSVGKPSSCNSSSAVWPYGSCSSSNNGWSSGWSWLWCHANPHATYANWCMAILAWGSMYNGSNWIAGGTDAAWWTSYCSKQKTKSACESVSIARMCVSNCNGQTSWSPVFMYNKPWANGQNVSTATCCEWGS